MQKTIKILAIGNSFSEDAMSYLWDIANNHGISLLLGNLFIGGCDLETHVKHMSDHESAYIYYKNTKGSFEPTQSTLYHGLMDESWDVITIQQASYKSGLIDTYEPYLSNLIDFIERHQPHSSIYWHMTWAYQRDSDHPNFIDYKMNQDIMYQMIKETLQKKILTNQHIDRVIYTGKVIQTFRSTEFGDTLTRDGFHLSLDIGRYLASLSWFLTFFPEFQSQIKHLPWISRHHQNLIDLTFETINLNSID